MHYAPRSGAHTRSGSWQACRAGHRDSCGRVGWLVRAACVPGYCSRQASSFSKAAGTDAGNMRCGLRPSWTAAAMRPADLPPLSTCSPLARCPCSLQKEEISDGIPALALQIKDASSPWLSSVQLLFLLARHASLLRSSIYFYVKPGGSLRVPRRVASLREPFPALYLSLNWHTVRCHLGPQGGVKVPCSVPTFGTLELARRSALFLESCPSYKSGNKHLPPGLS